MPPKHRDLALRGDLPKPRRSVPVDPTEHHPAVVAAAGRGEQTRTGRAEHEGLDGTDMSAQHSDLLARIALPQSYGFVVGAGDQPASVRAEGPGCGALRMPAQDSDLLSRLAVPKPGPVHANRPGDDSRSRRIERDAVDALVFRSEMSDGLSSGDIPESRARASRPRHDAQP